jgi:hypothetical protein
LVSPIEYGEIYREIVDSLIDFAHNPDILSRALNGVSISVVRVKETVVSGIQTRHIRLVFSIEPDFTNCVPNYTQLVFNDEPVDDQLIIGMIADEI